VITIRKVFLEELPCKQGIGANSKKQVTDWKNSKGYKVKFIYDDIEGYITIFDYNSKKQQLELYYNDEKYFIRTGDFQKCGLSHILKLRTNEYFYKLNETVNGVKIIKCTRQKLSNGTNVRAYEYKCPICGYIGIRLESNFKAGQNCAVCFGHSAIMKGINDIATTDPWMIQWLSNKEDAYKYKSQSHSKILFKCIYCGCEKLRKIDHFYSKKLGCCNDGLSYPNKFIFSLLQQLNLTFKPEYKAKWSNSKRYDFYFKYNNEKYIIEANGEQHYEKSFYTMKNGRTLEDEQENDRFKKELALQNDIKEENYIIIDCRLSNLDWIKNNILKSNLASQINLNAIDWLKCHEFACSNRVKEACDIWNTYNFEFATDLGKTMNISGSTAQKYLKMGNRLNWCNYDSEKANINKYKKATEINKLINSKAVICLETKQVYISATECANKSLKDFGVIMNNGGISRVCREERNYHKGHHFKYIEYLTPEEYIKYDIANKLKGLHNENLKNVI